MIRTALTLAAIVLIAAESPAEEKSLRVYFVGNSVTDTINYRALAGITITASHAANIKSKLKRLRRARRAKARKPEEVVAAASAPTLTAAIAGLPPFDLTLGEFKTFRHRRESYTLWLKPEPEEPVVELYEVLSRASLEDQRSSEQVSFQPHLSVGQVQGKDRMSRLVEELQAAWEPMTFRVDRVRTIWRREPPDDVFRVAEEIPLADESLERGARP